MSQFIHLTATTNKPISIRREHILSIYSENYNSMPATFLKLGSGVGQYVLETREWIVQELENPGEPNHNEKWMKVKEPIIKTPSPPQESKSSDISPSKAPNSTPKAIKTKIPPKSQVIKKGPPKRK